MNRLRVVVAEDELLARKRMVRLLGSMPEVEVVGVHTAAAGLLAQLAEDAVDIVVLDIQMPGLSGIEAHARIPEGGPFVIFATAHPEHAVAAFELGAVDYVLKPIDAARLAKAVDRARAHVLRRREADTPRSAGDPLARLPIVTRAGVVLVDFDDVSHAEFDGVLVTIHRRNAEPLLTEFSLQDLGQRLPEPQFDRVHRRALVNLREVTMLLPQDTGGFVAVMRSGAHVLVSRQSARRLRRWLGLSKTSDGDGDAKA
jgi:two-component system, LytTR family, response regulator